MDSSRYRASPRLGFTLVEVMVTLAILVIVGAIALPSYLGSVRKGRRSDAADAAVTVLQAQERWRATHVSYTAAVADLGVSATSPGGYYTLALSNATAGGYTLTFTPVAGRSQASDTPCVAMTVAVANGSPTHAPASCWSR